MKKNQMKKVSKYLLIATCIILFSFCSSNISYLERIDYVELERPECRDKIKSYKTPFSDQVRAEFLDSLEKWRQLNLKYTPPYGDSYCYVHDFILFSQDSKICIIFILQVDTLKDHVFNEIIWFPGVKKETNWDFLYGDNTGLGLRKDSLEKQFHDIHWEIDGRDFGKIESYFFNFVSNYFLDENCEPLERMFDYGNFDDMYRSHNKYLNNPIKPLESP